MLLKFEVLGMMWANQISPENNSKMQKSQTQHQTHSTSIKYPQRNIVQIELNFRLNDEGQMLRSVSEERKLSRNINKSAHVQYYEFSIFQSRRKEKPL